MDKFQIQKKIEQGLKGLSETLAVNFSVTPSLYNYASLVLLWYLTNKLKFNGLYISLNKPYESIYKELKQNKLDVNRIYFIDGVGKETGEFLQSNKCFCLEDPASLVELSVLIKALCNENKIKFIVLDSLNTLLLYNNVKEVERFIHNTLNRARKSGISVVVMSSKEKSKEGIVAEITQFCDKRIEL